MLDAALAIQEFVGATELEEYRANRMLRGAVERYLEIIGEAAGRVSDAFRRAHSELPWRSIIGQRNILAHSYGSVDDDLVWRVATERIPELITALRTLVPPLRSTP